MVTAEVFGSEAAYARCCAESSDATLHGADSEAADDKPQQLGESRKQIWKTQNKIIDSFNQGKTYIILSNLFITPSEILMKDQKDTVILELASLSSLF